MYRVATSLHLKVDLTFRVLVIHVNFVLGLVKCIHLFNKNIVDWLESFYLKYEALGEERLEKIVPTSQILSHPRWVRLLWGGSVSSLGRKGTLCFLQSENGVTRGDSYASALGAPESRDSSRSTLLLEKT